VTLTGKGLDPSLQLALRLPGASIELRSVEPTQATAAVALPDDAPLGPFGLWISRATGPQEPLAMLVDRLPVIIDNGHNHSTTEAQPIQPSCVIEGHCEPSQRDVYRLTVMPGQRLAFEVHTQAIGSSVDPVLHLIDAEGRTLHLADDDAVGPDCRFSYHFESAGDVWLEVHDNRFAAGDYLLRIGDFPIVTHAYPLAVKRGEKTTIHFAGNDALDTEEHVIEMTSPAGVATRNVPARLKGGRDATWLPIGIRDHPQWRETDAGTPPPLALPVSLHGRLQQSSERDVFSLQGTQGQAIRVSSHTRDFGSPAMLEMQLFNAQDKKLAETKVSQADQSSFAYTFPDDGSYRLEVSDLLQRGGEPFGYWVEVTPTGTFSLSLKPDPKTRQQFAIEASHGAGAVDLQIERFGYDGPIELSLPEGSEGLQLLNPLIPTKANAARLFFCADATWNVESVQTTSLLGTATESPHHRVLLNSDSLHHLKKPFLLVPPAWNGGVLQFAGAPAVESPLALQPEAPLQFARATKTHSATLLLKRNAKEFKEPVTLLGSELPAGWSMSVKADKDRYVATWTQADSADTEPEALTIQAFTEFQNRGRLETVKLPIEWFDPVKVTLSDSQRWIAGETVTLIAKVTRQGNDAQPVNLTWESLPDGVSAPETVVVAADQSTVELELKIAKDAEALDAHSLRLLANSRHAGNDLSVASNAIEVSVIPTPAKLEVFPPRVLLQGPRARRRLVVTGVDAHDAARDWTRETQMRSADPSIASVTDGIVWPHANGDTEIILTAGDIQTRLPVRVVEFASKSPIAFESEVLVALSKQGCNSGACHGSPSGKGGFRLSLRAFDRKLDELTLIREDYGRRVNTLDAAASLLLLKPTMKVAHGGGKQLHADDDAYSILRDWIAEGAHVDPPQTARCEKLVVYPDQKRVLSLVGGGQQLSAVAQFGDGAERDVSHLVAYESSNTNVATVDQHGWVTPHRQGETVILVRYLEHIESVPLMFVQTDDEFQWRAPPSQNYIDELVNAKLQQLQYLPSDPCSDAEYVRRVHLDLIGLLPTAEEAQAFLADAHPEKRKHLVDDLLERQEYAKFWALKWGDLLQMTRNLVGEEGVYKYHRWLEQSLRDNMPYDQFAKQLLTATGSTLSNPPANFYRTATDMNECVETISQVFLGARLQCAKCHNHPFERWTQDNYYGLGAFFHRVARRDTGRPGEMFVYSVNTGDVIHPRTAEKMAPWLPQTGSLDMADETIADGRDRRQRFAEWLVDPANPYFARIEANRIWSQLFARGIVDPIDDFRDSNPPSNGPLLDALADDFVGSGYDRKHLLRTILASQTYQASYRTNESNQVDTLYFSHQEPRLLSAEQLLDAINSTLGLTQTFGSLPVGTKATQLPAPDIIAVDFLKVFGQPERSTVCACERVEDSNLGMAIELFNGSTIHQKLRDPNNRFRKLLANGRSIEQTVRELYLAAVSRPPSEQELRVALAHCSEREGPAAGLEDVCWALFNTDEFLFQH